MIITDQRLSSTELQLLGRLVHQTWRSISGSSMLSFTFAWEDIRISTSDFSIELRLRSAPLDIDGHVDDYPTLGVGAVPADVPPHPAGNTYYQGQNEKVHEILVLRDVVQGERHGTPFFKNSADIAVAIRLDSSWLVFCRASHFMNGFDVQQVAQLGDAELPITTDEWESTLEYRYSLSREWIRV